MLIKTEWLGYLMVKKLWRYIRPFSCDTGTLRTDRRKDRQTDLLYQYRASVYWRAIKNHSKIAQWACRYCIAFGRWCILISSLLLLRFLSHFLLYYLLLNQLTSISVINRILLTVWILYFHAITWLPHTHALCMTQNVVRYVKMRTGAARGLER